jgi:hypothetical protein
MCNAKGHVRFAPNIDRESGFPQTVMSALPPKADMCSAPPNVCFGPKADMQESGSEVVVLTRIILCVAASGFISCFRLQNGDSVVHRQWRNLH